MTSRTGLPLSPLNRAAGAACPPWCGTSPEQLPDGVVFGHVLRPEVFCSEACRDRAIGPAKIGGWGGPGERTRPGAPPDPDRFEDETVPLPTHCEGCGARYTLADLMGGHEHRAPEVALQGSGSERLAVVLADAAASLPYDGVLAGIRATVERAGAGHPWSRDLERAAEARLEAVRDAILESRPGDPRRASWRRQLAAAAEVLGLVARARRSS